MGDVAAFGLVISIARHDDHSPAGKRPANRFESLASDDDVMAHSQFAEALQICGQSPGEFVVDADPALPVHRRNDRNDHTDTCVSSCGKPKLWIIVTAQVNKSFVVFEAKSRLSSHDIFAKKHCCLR